MRTPVGDVGIKLGLAESSAGKGPSLNAIGHSRAGARLEKDGNQGHPRWQDRYFHRATCCCPNLLCRVLFKALAAQSHLRKTLNSTDLSIPFTWELSLQEVM